ncbi:MAG: hypothetical protein ACRDEA_18115 [Microcystaceae cyanobacterium]
MSTERLDRIEAILERTAAEREVDRREMAELRSMITSLARTVEIHQQYFEIIIAEIRDMTSEIRGLQLENRRILERVFGREDEEL